MRSVILATLAALLLACGSASAQPFNYRYEFAQPGGAPSSTFTIPATAQNVSLALYLAETATGGTVLRSQGLFSVAARLSTPGGLASVASVADITRNAGVSLAGRDVLLVGAGGAAAGVLGPLLLAGARHITVANRTLAKAQALVQSHSALAALQKAELSAQDPLALSPHFDVIINATASSLSGGGIPVPASVLRPGALAYDMMYGPAAQGFLDWARQHGAVPRDGLGMLVEQAAEAFLLWRGVRPPSAQVLREMQQSATA